MPSEISAANGKYKLQLANATSTFGIVLSGIDGTRQKVWSIDLPSQAGVKWIANYEIRENNVPINTTGNYTLQIDQALLTTGQSFVIFYKNKSNKKSETVTLAAPGVDPKTAGEKITYKKASVTAPNGTYQVIEVTLPWGDPAIGIS